MVELSFQIAAGILFVTWSGLQSFPPLLALSLLSSAGILEIHPSLSFLSSEEAALAFASGALVEMLEQQDAGRKASLLLRPAAAALSAAGLFSLLPPLLVPCAGIPAGLFFIRAAALSCRLRRLPARLSEAVTVLLLAGIGWLLPDWGVLPDLLLTPLCLTAALVAALLAAEIAPGLCDLLSRSRNGLSAEQG